MQARRSIFPMRLSLGLVVLATTLGGQPAPAQSRFSVARVSVANSQISPFITSLDQQFDSGGGFVSATATQAFTGLDRDGVTRTMLFAGRSAASADFGRLRGASTMNLTNSYYNESNAPYYNSNTGVVNPDGSPDVVGSDTLTGFSDVLYFGGTLESGYRARYIFHVDGTNSGGGGGAVLGVTIASNPTETFGNFSPGFFVADWATQSYPVNGITPETVNVQFDTVASTFTSNIADGGDFFASADYAATLTLAGIELLRQDGGLASGWTVTSASGTIYNAIQGPSVVPEPGNAALLLALAGAGVLARRRRR